MITRRVVAEARMKFGQFDDIGARGGVSSYVAPDMPILRENDDVLSSLHSLHESQAGDRLSPIQRPPVEPRAPQQGAPRRPDVSGPTTPRSGPSDVTPSKPSAAGRASIGVHDFGHGVTGRLSSGAPPPAVGPHDFARGLAPRASAPTVPPHAQRALRSSRNRIMHRSDAEPSPPPGHGHNAVMRRGAGSLAATAAPKGAAFTRHIYEAARSAGIPETQARLAAAQAAHESFYGRRAPGHNYFGVKGSGTAGSQMLRTHEQGRRGLYATQGRFARYAAPEDSLKHWWAKIQRQWPQAAGASNFEEAVKGLRAGQRGGYATDARYNEKIRRIAATLAQPSSGSLPRAIAGGTTPQGQVPPTSTAGR